MAEGRKKDEALRLAKIAFLEKNHDNDYRHPYWWSGITISGNMAPLKSSNYQWFWLFSLLMLIPIGFWYFRKKKN